MFVLLVVLSLVQVLASSPVRTILCCCGCTEHPCPMVGPNCPPPTTTCSNSSSDIQCSEVQHLFDISHSYDDLEDMTEDISSPLLPSLDSVAIVPENRMSSMQKIERMMGGLELLTHKLRTEFKTLSDYEDDNKNIKNIDASLRPVRRVTREKRAEMTENCNDDKLKKIIKDHIKKDAKSSKRDIQKAANKEFGGHFNVICSPCEFSFVVASQKYCDGFKDNVACFAFLQPPTKLKIEE